MRVTIACPEAMVGDANQFARAIGVSAADDQTFGLPTWRDADGAAYAVASGIVTEAFPARATGPLVEPEWGADMEAAERAQAALAIGATASPGVLAAVIGEDIPAALTALGVERGPEV